MAITKKTIMDEGIKAKIDNYYAPNTIALLIDDQPGDLTGESSIAEVVAKELPEGNGYERKQVSLSSAFIENNGSSKKARADSLQMLFTAQGGNIPVFSHICFIVGGSLIIGDTSGVIDRIEPSNSGEPIGLNNGRSYRHSFIQRESGNYITS